MQVLVAGGTGFIGLATLAALRQDHTLSVVSRQPERAKAETGLESFGWHELNAHLLGQFDAVINLAGENIGAGRWNKARRQRILASRQETTAQLAKLCISLGAQAPYLINASAIGIFSGSEATGPYTEDDTPERTDRFLNYVAHAWEDALTPYSSTGRTSILRFGIVLGKGGALAKMLPSFYLGAGARLGSGEQPFSWVSLHDVTRAIRLCLSHPDARGTYHVVTASPTQDSFAQALSSHLNRPYWLHLPKQVIHALFGQMGQELLLEGQQVQSTRLSELGFRFEDPTLNHTFTRIFGS